MTDVSPQQGQPLPPIQFQVGELPQMPGVVILSVQTPFGVQSYPMSGESAKSLAEALKTQASGITVAPASALQIAR